MEGEGDGPRGWEGELGWAEKGCGERGRWGRGVRSGRGASEWRREGLRERKETRGK